MNQKTIRQLLAATAVLLFILLGWLGYSTFQFIEDNQLSPVSGPLLRNTYFPTTNQENIHYYNGDTFVSYDTETKGLRQLTAIRGITDITKVDWVKDGVVFSVSTISPWHPLWNQYNTYIDSNDGDSAEGSFSNDTTVHNYHWYLSFKNNSISLLSVGVDNALLYATPTKEGGLLFRDPPYYSLLQSDGVIKRNIANLPNDSSEQKIIYADADSYIFTAEDGENVIVGEYSFTTKKMTRLIDRLYATSNRSLYDQVLYDAGKLFYLEPTGSGSVSSVHEYELSTKKHRKIIDNFQGTFTTSTGITAVHIGNEYTKLYNVTNIDRSTTVKNSFTIPQNILLANNSTFYTTREGYLMKVGEPISDTTKDISLEKKITSDTFVLSRNIESLNDNSYTVTIISGDLQAQMNTLYESVRKAGYDPLMFSFTANPGPRVTY